MADLTNLTPLTHEDAIKALKSGERLVNNIQSSDILHYHYFQGKIYKSYSYVDPIGDGNVIEENELPQLYRFCEIWNNADEELKNIITQLLDSGNYPKSIKKFEYDGLKTLVIQMIYLNDKPFTKKLVEAILSEMEEPAQEADTSTENNENYLSISFKKDGKISATNYWECISSKNGILHLVHHLGTYSLLLPYGMDLDDGNAFKIYITRGTYQGKKDCFEIVFDNGTDNPLRLFLHHSQLTVVKPMEKGQKGQLYIYSAHSKLDMFYYSFKDVCYRETDTLPSTLNIQEKNKTTKPKTKSIPKGKQRPKSK